MHLILFRTYSSSHNVKKLSIFLNISSFEAYRHKSDGPIRLIAFKVIVIYLNIGYSLRLDSLDSLARLTILMVKNNFLLVDLNEQKTKKLAETITSETSRKILNYLAEKEHDTEANIAKELNVPISTIHYHLQKLQEAQLIIVKEFHYSAKGREVNHYQLANKYIIIAPRKVSGLREKLKGILPVAGIVIGISGVIKFIRVLTTRSAFSTSENVMVADSLSKAASVELAQEAVFYQGDIPLSVPSPDIAAWFLIGAGVTILVYVLVAWIKELVKKD